MTKCDEFEIEIFEAKAKIEKAGICGTCSIIFATWILFFIAGVSLKFKKMCLARALNQFDLSVLKVER